MMRPSALAARRSSATEADIWAAHAVQHLFEMTGRPRDGIVWTEGASKSNWRECNNFAYHALWHRCLFLLELGDVERVLELYDREVRPASTDDLLDISNAVSNCCGGWNRPASMSRPAGKALATTVRKHTSMTIC